MKKVMKALVCGLLSAVLLSACASGSGPAAPAAADPTETSPVLIAPPETAPNTTPEAAPGAEYPIPGEPMDGETLAQWQAFFDEDALRMAEDHQAYCESGDYWQIHWRTRALCSYYASPERVNIPAFFYDGGFPGEEPTEEEKAWVYAAKYGDGEHGAIEVHRYSAEKVDMVLKAYFGLSLGKTQKVGLYPEKNFLYNPETDCYYTAHNDALAAGPRLLAGYTLADGSVALVYVDQCLSYSDTDGQWRTGTLESFTVLEPQEDGTWRFLCNLPLDGFTYFEYARLPAA